VPSKAAQHAEIARRYKRRKYHRPTSKAAIRISELNRVFRKRYGAELPDDDAGRDDVLLMAHHMATTMSGNVQQRIAQWVDLRAPWMSVRELRTITRDAIEHPRRWKADTLGWRLRLTDQERTELRITTIGAFDVGKDERLARRRNANRLAKQAKRRAAGMKPRHVYEAQSVSRAKPWQALGMSRRTWYRLGKP
jgi:hypothetical protein